MSTANRKRRQPKKKEHSPTVLTQGNGFVSVSTAHPWLIKWFTIEEFKKRYPDSVVQ